MKYDINKLPDFFSVRDFTQIDYALEDMEGMKCFTFFDNGFKSNIIEPNKRDIRFIWDGFILFVNPVIDLDDMQNGVNLWDARIVALQRTDLLGKKANSQEVRSYILSKLSEKNIPVVIMEDNKDIVGGYPSKCDLWSTREKAVLVDAANCTGSGNAYYFKDSPFNYEIEFNKSLIPSFLYKHDGALVLRGENSTAISRLVANDSGLKQALTDIIGEEKIPSLIEGRKISGTTINNVLK